MTGFVWDIDPALFKIGPLELRYYGLLFGATLLLGYHLFRKQMEKRGYGEDISEKFLMWGVLGVVVGARLVHCLFYEPGYYLSNPLEILKIYKGGIASHGATLGLFTVVLIFSRKYKIPFMILGDALVFAAAVGATFVRIGNFFNSEIVGRVTTLPWGVHFMRYIDKGQNLRHPSQLYEAFGGFVVLMTLILVDKKVKQGKPGLFAGIFLVMYFSFRFLIEFVKEYQTLSSFLTMGQYLSIPFVLIGVYFIYSWFSHRRLQNESQ